MPNLVLENDMRVGAIGRTRTGKTFLMHKLLQPQPRVIVVDSKKRVRWPGYSLTDDPLAALLGDKVIYRHDDKIPDTFWYDARESLVERGGGIIYIDEAPYITSANYAPRGIKDLLRLGGEEGVGCWWSAQEATGVYNTLIRQSEVLLLFLNHGASDRDKLIRTCGDIAEATASLDLWEFMVYESGGRSYDPDHLPVYRYNGTT